MAGSSTSGTWLPRSDNVDSEAAAVRTSWRSLCAVLGDSWKTNAIASSSAFSALGLHLTRRRPAPISDAASPLPLRVRSCGQLPHLLDRLRSPVRRRDGTGCPRASSRPVGDRAAHGLLSWPSSAPFLHGFPRTFSLTRD